MTGTALRSPASTATSDLARVVFTGRLMSLDRRRAGDLVRGAGGVVTTTVSRRTSMLVVGMNGWPIRPDGSVSRKLRRAETLNAAGGHVRIASEAVFLELTGVTSPRPRPPKGYSLDQVGDLLGLEHDVLRRWEALGLIVSHEDRYDFQDIVSLRTIAELIGRGVRPSAIAASVRGLAAVLPDVERPLAQLKLVERSGALLAEIGDALIAPDGQLVLNFDAPRREPGDAMSLSAFDADDSLTAEQWFSRGAACEEDERFEDAVEAYRRSLGLRPDAPETHFNLGNALRAIDRLAAAEEHFMMAVTQAPAMAAAWFNLADVQEERGNLPDAIESLRAALTADPSYADAHYNLAACHEAAGDADDARRHWAAYLKLDATSTWADTARAHLGQARAMR